MITITAKIKYHFKVRMWKNLEFLLLLEKEEHRLACKGLPGFDHFFIISSKKTRTFNEESSII